MFGTPNIPAPKMPETPTPILQPTGTPGGGMSAKRQGYPSILGSDFLPNTANTSNKTLLGQ